MFKFEISEDESKKAKLKEGPASFKIIDASDKDEYDLPLKTRDGKNSMLKVVLSITDCAGSKGVLYDYFPANLGWKIRALLKSVNRSTWVSSGQLAPSELKNLYGHCILKSDASPEYPDRVKVGSYTEREKIEAAVDARPQDLYEDDLGDIPF
jgi:hypothetical protein